MIKSTITTEVREHLDMKKFYAALKGFEGAYVSIGVHEGAGKYPDGQEVVQVALWNEFGTETIPERSFIRSAVAENEKLINQWREEMLANVVLKNWTVPQALEAMGFRIQTLIQNKIKSDVPPPLADETAKQKRRDGVAPVTLIDTGLLLRSITFKVHKA